MNRASSAIRKLRSLTLVAALTVLILATDLLAADTPTLELVQTIVLKGPAGVLDHAVLDTKHERLLVANKGNNTLDIVDLKAGKLLKQLPGQRGAQGVAYAPDLDRVFVALGTGGFCNVFDGTDYKLLKSIKFADDADNVRYDAKSQRAYVAHAEQALGVIDAKTLEIISDIKLPGAAEAFQKDPSRARLFVNVPSPAQIVAIDTDKNEIAGQFPLKLAGGNHPLVFDADNHRLLIGCRKAPVVVVMDSETGKEISSTPIAGDNDDLFLDAKHKRLYASCGEGFISVLRQVDPDHYEPQEKIATAKGARTCFFDAEAGRLYLIVPRQAGKEGPEVRVYRTHP